MFPIPGAVLIHTFLETLGILLAFGLYQRQRQQKVDPVSDKHRSFILIAAVFGAFLGSRLLGSLEHPGLFIQGGGSAGWAYYLLAKTIVGGLLGGLWAVEITKRWLGIAQRTGDLYVYPLLLAMMIGRLGCFAMGVQEPTYGLPTSSWLGIDLGDGIPRHPTALYEFVVLGLIWIFLRLLQRQYSLRSGRLFMLFMVCYLSYRFLIGFLQPMIKIGGLGAIQWACLAGLLWYIWDEQNGAGRSTTSVQP
ncbi:MAG: prolipoprotein diacylglyceryl transferase family protein [Bacteroidota bacterium]